MVPHRRGTPNLIIAIQQNFVALCFINPSNPIELVKLSGRFDHETGDLRHKEFTKT